MFGPWGEGEALEGTGKHSLVSLLVVRGPLISEVHAAFGSSSSPEPNYMLTPVPVTHVVQRVPRTGAIEVEAYIDLSVL